MDIRTDKRLDVEAMLKPEKPNCYSLVLLISIRLYKVILHSIKHINKANVRLGNVVLVAYAYVGYL